MSLPAARAPIRAPRWRVIGAPVARTAARTAVVAKASPPPNLVPDRSRGHADTRGRQQATPLGAHALADDARLDHRRPRCDGDRPRARPRRTSRPAALVNFMGAYWILNGIVTFRWGLAAEGLRRRLPLAAGAIATVTGAVVL